MHYQALAVDYDGTLAHHSRVDEDTLAGLRKLLASGRKLLLVTGRRLCELTSVFPEFSLCDWIVAENGALLHEPKTGETRLLAATPPASFLDELRHRGVSPFDVGEVIVATWEPHQAQVLEAIHHCKLELQVIFNKGAVMILPSGVNKATGLTAALHVLGLQPENVVAMGDAENDHAFLELCGCSVAVANALDSLKEKADLVALNDHGRGVIEVIKMLLANDMADVPTRLRSPAGGEPIAAPANETAGQQANTAQKQHPQCQSGS